MGDDAVKGYIVKALEELDENETPKLEAPAAVIAAPAKPAPPPPPPPPCPDKVVEIQVEEPAPCPHADPKINIVSQTVIPTADKPKIKAFLSEKEDAKAEELPKP